MVSGSKQLNDTDTTAKVGGSTTSSAVLWTQQTARATLPAVWVFAIYSAPKAPKGTNRHNAFAADPFMKTSVNDIPRTSPKSAPSAPKTFDEVPVSGTLTTATSFQLLSPNV